MCIRDRQYGKDVTYSGPLFKTMKVEGNKAVLSFDYADDGLMTPDNEPVKGFIVAGEDRRFYPATALIRGDKLEVSAPQVSVPVAVRYAYCNFFRVNLYNKAGFPATPFRTDTWEPDSYARWFADSEMVRFPKAYQLDHGKRLFFGYAQGVGCCAMLRMWKKTGERLSLIHIFVAVIASPAFECLSIKERFSLESFQYVYWSGSRFFLCWYQ